MKTAKKNILIHNMLLLLTENEHISVSRMASVLGISESTIRRNLSSLEEAVKESLGTAYFRKFREKACIYRYRRRKR